MQNAEGDNGEILFSPLGTEQAEESKVDQESADFHGAKFHHKCLRVNRTSPHHL